VSSDAGAEFVFGIELVSTVAFDRIGLLSLFKVEHLSNYTGEIMSLKLSCFLLGLQL